MAHSSLPPLLTHAYAEEVASAFIPHPSQQLFFDEAAGCLHVLQAYTITTARLPPSAALAHGASSAVFQAPPQHAAAAPLPRPGPDADTLGLLPSVRFGISQGAPVLLIRAQPPAPAAPKAGAGPSQEGGATAAAAAAAAVVGAGGSGLTAVQRSARLIEFVDPGTGNLFLEGPSDRHGRPVSLRGFFWTCAPGCQFVMVTDQGLEMYSLQPGGQGLKLGGIQRLHDVRWYLYCHRIRMAVVGCGEAGTKLQAFQFTTSAAIKLPPLDLASPLAPPPRPPPSPLPPPGAASPPPPPRSPPPLSPAPARGSPGKARGATKITAGADCVWVVSLYGRVYCCHLDKAKRVLRLYRMYRDAVMLFHEYEVFTDSAALCVVDSVLVVLDAHSGMALLLDVMTGLPCPLCAPLPLGLPPGVAAQQPAQHRGWAAAPPGGHGAAPVAGGDAALPALMLCPPHWLVDPGSGALCRLRLDLAAVVETCSDWATLVAFLQRRGAGGGPGDPSSPFALTLQVIKGLLQERVALHTVAQVFQAANLAYRDAGRLVEAAPHDSGTSIDDYPVVSPEAMTLHVFGWLHEEQVVDSQYLQAVLGQYLASCQVYGTAVPPSLAVLYVETLLDQGRGYLLGAVLSSLLILDSHFLADHLELLAQQGRLAEGRQLAQDMYWRLGDMGACCHTLLRAGSVPQALRAVQRYRVESVPPVLCLEAAAQLRDEVLFAAVYRFCRERVKPFLPEYPEVREQYTRWFTLD